MDQIDLNKKLYDEFEKKEIDENKIVELLKMGANPLGNMTERPHFESPYEESIYENKNLYIITKILLENGMVIDNKDFSDNPDEHINPLWSLAFRTDTIGIKTLKLLLDYNTDVASIEILIDHIYTDHIFLEGKNDEESKAKDNNVETEVYNSIAMKMIMLCASYEYALDNSDFIKDIIDYEKNDKDLIKGFKHYNDFYVRETKKELRFYNKKDNSLTWVMYY